MSGTSRQISPQQIPSGQILPRQIFIDSQDFAYRSRELQGKIAVAELPRLQDMLAAPEGELSYTVRGIHSKAGQPMLEVALEGICQLRCQRCLQSMAYQVNLVSHLILVPPEQLDEAAADDEENDAIPADTQLDVLALLEEELLLSLPFAPKHAAGSCEPDVAVAERLNRENPFAVLAELKNK